MADLEAEVADYIGRHEGLVDEAGRRLVVRNGKAAERPPVTGAGALRVRAPRVHDRRDGRRFSSYILPAYACRSPKVADVLPVLYLRGLSTGDFAPALAEFFGSDAGLSASTITRLLETWAAEYTAFEGRDLSGDDYVHVWADGVISVSVSKRTGCALWSSSVSKPMAPKNSWPVLTGIGNRPSPGPTYCETSQQGVWGLRWWRLVTVSWVLGRARRRVPRNTRAALLGAQDSEYSGYVAEAAAPPGASGNP